MALNNLKVTIIKAEGCSNSKVGITFFIRNGCIEIPAGKNLCIFALGSILPAISAAVIKNKPGEGMLDFLQEWQCPDPLAKAIFKIEEE
jgi:uncharacterized repeat protein (TIGR04076 family)